MDDPLARFFSAEAIAKLERFVSQQEPQHQQFPLPMLRLAAFALAAIGDQAEQLTMTGPGEQASFALDLDQAGEAILAFIAVLRLEIASVSPPPSLNTFLHMLDAYVYPLSDVYWQRRARILERGKRALLIRFSARLAERRLKP